MKNSHNTPIIIAFSGGPDSVFLTEFLWNNGYTNLILAHFNHHIGLRNGENNTDESFSKQYAASKNIPLEIGNWDTPCASEEKARTARYAFLESVRTQYGAQWIAVAHHQDDQAETVLLQFLRSGGLKSLTGMKEYNTDRHIWRPLLNISKSEIVSFLHENTLAYCTDSSNSESVFTRNWIRNEVFPLLQTRFPNVTKHLAQQSSHFQKTEHDIETLADTFLTTHCFTKGVPCSELVQEMHETQVEIIRRILVKKSISSSFLEAFFALVSNPNGGKKLETKYQIFLKQKGVLFVQAK